MVVIIILMLKDNKMFFNYNFLHFFFLFKWYCFNDDYVEKVSENDALK
jgi:hypothetical protein